MGVAITTGLQVGTASFGDPAPDEEAAKSLSLKYKPCETWETEGFGAALAKLQAVADAERAALRRVVKAQTKERLRFNREKAWAQFFLKTEGGGGRQAAPEVVELIVGHRERVCVKRSTLMLCPDSALARRFDADMWAQDADGGGGGSDEDSDEDEGSDEDGAISIEEEPYSFCKLVDQLRLVAIAEPGDPPPAPTVPKHKVVGFDKLLDYYFKGVEGFVKTDGKHQLAGTTVRQRIETAFEVESFDFSGSIIDWKVPPGVRKVQIDAWGAQGGVGTSYRQHTPGKGAHLRGSFKVVPGETLQLLVGGVAAEDASHSAGGGGGTFVSRKRTPLIVAGGGGGRSQGSCDQQRDASLTDAGKQGGSGEMQGGSGGTNGNGGVADTGDENQSGKIAGAPGGGYQADGSSNGAGVPAGPGRAFLNGGAGGVYAAGGVGCDASGGSGGFGGGGSGGYHGGGGGGGYSGGGGGGWNGGGGGGGGSFNCGMDPYAKLSDREGSGHIVISSCGTT